MSIHEAPAQSQSPGDHAPEGATHHVRYHALDCLRASMMSLGLVIHAAVSYTTVSLGAAWPYQDPSTSPVCDILVFFIHTFRMPIFFVLAGFFAALVRDRRGLGDLLRNRVRRILIPFVIGWIILNPLLVYGFRFARKAGGFELPPEVRAQFGPTGPYVNGSTMHLWFLYFLIIFYTFVAILDMLGRRLGDGPRNRADATVRRIVSSPWRALILAVPTTLLLLTMRAGTFETSSRFLPAPKALIGYFLFFGFGWLLYAQRDLLPRFGNRAWLHVSLGLLICPVNLIAVTSLMGSLPERDPVALIATASSGALMVWLFFFGFTGLVLRYFDHPMPRLRYLTDASYWLYLAHLPLMIWLPGVLAPLSLPALVKMAIVLAVSVPILIVSYHYLVRPTFIGATLNGRRFPTRLSPIAPNWFSRNGMKLSRNSIPRFK
ncbi:acyltransferase family protein [Tautonia marina]|uniref:acyltransferase family protein n=1 Tax=Tautonia marina TaxID=2653855 RepID=UPI0012608D34|nr:acyltransferase family protein [Tautonia marina]